MGDVSNDSTWVHVLLTIVRSGEMRHLNYFNNIRMYYYLLHSLNIVNILKAKAVQ